MKTGNQRKIAFIVPIVAPYRITFFEKLNRILQNDDFVIFHGFKKKEDGRPAYDGNISVKNRTYAIEEKKIGMFQYVLNRGLNAQLYEYNPEIIILQGAVGVLSNWLILFWAKLHRKKIIFWTCGWEPERTTVYKYIKNLLLYFFFNLSDYHIAYSTTAKNYLIKKGVNPKKIAVAYNGIESDVEPITIGRDDDPELMEDQNKLVFLYVGGIFREKKLELLVDAFNMNFKNSNSHVLWIVGDGPDKSALESKYSDCANIRFFGRRIADVDKFFKLADITVLPGIGGLAINQSMLWGTPVIVSEADGTEVDLVIEDETGFRFIKNDLNSLAGTMKHIAFKPISELAVISENARQLILKRSNVNEMVKTFYEVINR